MNDFREAPSVDPPPAVGYAAGWVGGALPVTLPALSLRSLAVEDVQAQREAERLAFEVEQHADTVLSRFKVRGEEPPTHGEILDRVDRSRVEERAAHAAELADAEDTERDSFSAFSPVKYFNHLRQKHRMRQQGKREAVQDRRERQKAQWRAERQEPGSQGWGEWV